MPVPSLPTIPSIPSIGGGGAPSASVLAIGTLLGALTGVSPGSLRALWLPIATDTTTTSSAWDGGRVWTYDATIAARISTQGSGVLVTFASATPNKADTPDTDDTTFSNNTQDSPFSIEALGSITDTAANRVIVSKDDNATNREWMFRIDTADMLRFTMNDEAHGNVQALRVSNAAITQGALHLFGVSYDGTGGATAANGVTLYQDAATVTSTATNNASYVAMQNGTAKPTIGLQSSGLLGFDGSLGFVAVYAANLSTAQHLAIKTAVNTYYGLSL